MLKETRMLTSKNPPLQKAFTLALLQWNSEANTRQMPWKGEKNPYRIWLSEIILQQTRVEQGLSYYHKFIDRFPDIHSLAEATDDEAFKHWEGLGYYSRCRNLLATARFISKELKGRFPNTYNGVLALKGVGPYTAAAISSFAFNLPHAVVDGNVYRVLSRCFGIGIPVDTTEGKKIFNELANRLIDPSRPAIYNQAIMDFGATVCKPVAPLCESCYLKDQCQAYLKNQVSVFPVKEKKIQVRKRWFYYLRLEYRDQVIIRQRAAKDIWQDLFEFPLIEMKSVASLEEVLEQAAFNGIPGIADSQMKNESQQFNQKLSHQHITGKFIYLQLKKKIRLPTGWLLVNKSDLQQYAFPQFINQYIRKEAFYKRETLLQTPALP